MSGRTVPVGLTTFVYVGYAFYIHESKPRYLRPCKPLKGLCSLPVFVAPARQVRRGAEVVLAAPIVLGSVGLRVY